MRKCLLTLFVVAMVLPATAQTLDNPYGTCDQQTLDEAVALERFGDREALRDHVQSFGCKLIYPREGFEQFPPERKRGEKEGAVHTGMNACPVMIRRGAMKIPKMSELPPEWRARLLEKRRRAREAARVFVRVCAEGDAHL